MFLSLRQSIGKNFEPRRQEAGINLSETRRVPFRRESRSGLDDSRFLCFGDNVYPGSGTGAICHGLLPRCGGKKSCNGSCLEGFKYIDCSIKRMIKKFDALGINREDIQVKIFGGSDMFGAGSIDVRSKTIGMENVMVAKTIIEKAGLRVAAFDTRGNQGRKILFFPHTGEVFLKRLRVAEALDPRQCNLVLGRNGQSRKGRTK